MIAVLRRELSQRPNVFPEAREFARDGLYLDHAEILVHVAWFVQHEVRRNP